MSVAQGKSRAPVATWLNLLCLDAPIVAVLWQQLFARSAHISTSRASAAALFATCWLIYLTDRVADSFSTPVAAPTSLRQRFAIANRGLLFTGIGVAVILELIAVPQLDAVILRRGVVVGVMALAYLAVNHLVGRTWHFLPAKEITIGCLFAAGVAASTALSFDVLSLFATLCALNCISIAYWERDLDAAQSRVSVATRIPSGSPLPTIACALLALAASALLFVAQPKLPFICIALSSSALALLNLKSLSISTDARTALADIALFTPALFLPVS